MVKLKGILNALQAAAIQPMSDHGSQLDLGVDFTEGEKSSKHERDQLQQLYSHEFQGFWEHGAIPRRSLTQVLYI